MEKFYLVKEQAGMSTKKIELSKEELKELDCAMEYEKSYVDKTLDDTIQNKIKEVLK